jgi:hypothetical protein
MVRAVTILLMIANLLICPLRCVVHEAAASETALAGCGCCAVEICDPVPEVPASPDEDCGCQSCICEGALLQLEVELPEPSWKVVWFGWRSPAPSQAGKVTLHFLSTADHENRLLSSARSTQVVLQSWQI